MRALWKSRRGIARCHGCRARRLHLSGECLWPGRSSRTALAPRGPSEGEALARRLPATTNVPRRRVVLDIVSSPGTRLGRERARAREWDGAVAAIRGLGLQLLESPGLFSRPRGGLSVDCGCPRGLCCRLAGPRGRRIAAPTRPRAPLIRAALTALPHSKHMTTVIPDFARTCFAEFQVDSVKRLHHDYFRRSERNVRARRSHRWSGN